MAAVRLAVAAAVQEEEGQVEEEEGQVEASAVRATEALVARAV